MDRAHLNKVLVWGLFGIFLFLGGWGLLWIRMFARDMNPLTGLAAPLTVIGIGFVCAVGALIYGLKISRGNPRNSPVRVASGVYVIAKLAEGKDGPVYDIDVYDGQVNLLVQVALADGTRLEFNTSREVFDTVGEGLRGKIVYQGRWLGQFERQIGAEADVRPYVP